MSDGKYILDQAGNPVLEEDLYAWAQWLETARRSIAQTDLGYSRVSAVFLGLDHSFGYGPPLLWETVVFGGRLDQYQDRYTTKEQAIEGHELAVQLCRRARRKFFARLRGR